MKKYVTPLLQFVTLRSEESIAEPSVRGCNGECTEDGVWEGVPYYVLNS